MPSLDLKILLPFSLLYMLTTINFLFGFLSPLRFFFSPKIYLFCFLTVMSLHCYRWGFSSCSEWGAALNCCAWTSHWGGFSCSEAQTLDTWAAVIVVCGLSSCDLRPPEHRLSSCGTRAYLLLGMWDLPGTGIEPISLALHGRFLTTGPPGKPHLQFSISIFVPFERLLLNLKWDIC